MSLRDLKKQFERDVKEICRYLNKQPITAFIEAFRREGIFKRYHEIYGDEEADLAQKILQKLTDDRRRVKKTSKNAKNAKKFRKLRFIICIRGLYNGVMKRIWVIAATAQTADLKRFLDEKANDIQEQADLFDEWLEEIEERTGITHPRLGARMAEMLNDMRRQLGLGSGPATPPLPAPEE